ncbi:MAG: hypothetical protein H6718_07770 [Polyangiaceae bacterium]|nr:hypothetical protein [Myxococcales bacterium]MCB9585279.1 hypothetical protein [Polyangiaceae bacterium]MCB9606704.1 hypothetical protein [Polyangiaceae bacterium]
MSLSDLNQRVTNAITLAEGLPKDSPRAWAAFREVSKLEEEIASLTSPQDLEGEIARLGAVASALSAKEPLRALRLGEQYVAHGLAADVAAKLQSLLDSAEQQVDALLEHEPTVEPARFTLTAV